MPVDIGIIAAGLIAELHADYLTAEPDANVTHVVDPDTERAERLADRFDAEAVAEWRGVVDAVDAIYLLTPPRIRVDIVRAAADAGTAVFCEKPLAATPEDGEALAAIVEESGIPFMTAFCQRYREPYRRLNELVADGTLGRPLQFYSVRVGAGPPGEDSWREDPEQACGMTVESLSHDIDLLRWWGGEIVAASGEALGSRADLAAFDDNLGASFRYADGAIGVLQASWSADIAYGRRGVIGTEGTAVLDGEDMFRTDRLRWERADGTAAGEETYDEAVATDLRYDAEGRAFLDAVLADEEPPITVHDGLRALEIAHAVLESSSMGLHDWMEADR